MKVYDYLDDLKLNKFICCQDIINILERAGINSGALTVDDLKNLDMEQLNELERLFATLNNVEDEISYIIGELNKIMINFNEFNVLDYRQY